MIVQFVKEVHACLGGEVCEGSLRSGDGVPVAVFRVEPEKVFSVRGCGRGILDFLGKDSMGSVFQTDYGAVAVAVCGEEIVLVVFVVAY